MLEVRHRRWRLAVASYVDGELDPALHSEIRRHLADCWDCSADAQTMRLIKTSLRRAGRVSGAELAVRRLHRVAAGIGTEPHAQHP